VLRTNNPSFSDRTEKGGPPRFCADALSEQNAGPSTPLRSAQDDTSNLAAYRLRGYFAEVGVFFVDPVLAGWGEDVEVDAIFEGGGRVREVAGDDEDFAGVDGVGGAVVEVEAEGAFGDEGYLLVGVRVTGDDAAFL
jgi:hypothetical protein